MSELTGDSLYKLLPAIYRTRDAAQGWPLRALLGVVETQMSAVERDIARLYDNWFIETCEEWVVPYIGDLLDARQLRPALQDTSGTALFTRRGYVANTLAYRRRKGTRALLEKLAQDVAGWPCVAVEMFQLLATTQHVNHTRLANRRTIDVRAPQPLELIGGAFDTASHTLEVRRAVGERGKYNVPSVALFLWRLVAFELETVDAVVDTGGGERFRVNPLGADVALFNRLATDPSFAIANTEARMPGPLRRLALHADLEEVRQTLAETGTAAPSRYFSNDPVVVIDAAGTVIPHEQIAVCDLTDWRLPVKTRTYTRSDGAPVTLPIAVALDPVLGRIAFPAGVKPRSVTATFSTGFSGPIGGGTFKRPLSAVGNREQYIVAGGAAALSAQLAAWEADKPTSALIELQDSLTYDLPPAFAIPAGLALEIRGAAAQRPLVAAADPTKPWAIDLEAGSSLTLDGLAVAASLAVTSHGDAAITVRDSTLVPGRALQPNGDPRLPGATSLEAAEDAGTITVTIERCIAGTVKLPLEDPATRKVSQSALTISSSIIDATGGTGDAVVAGSLKIDGSTVFGTIATTVLTRASNMVATGRIDAVRTQEGCCRFSYFPLESKVPRAFRCQPRFALQDITDPAAQQAVVDRVQPMFTSRRYGDAGYAQLLHSCPPEIRTGAEDESEMGAFQFLHQPQREANLRAAVDEYLRFGLDAGLFLVT